jgi:hypothetical protein
MLSSWRHRHSVTGLTSKIWRSFGPETRVFAPCFDSCAVLGAGPGRPVGGEARSNCGSTTLMSAGGPLRRPTSVKASEAAILPLRFFFAIAASHFSNRSCNGIEAFKLRPFRCPRNLARNRQAAISAFKSTRPCRLRIRRKEQRADPEALQTALQLPFEGGG